MMNGINSQATIAVLRSVFARHPSSNGAAENVVNTVKSVLKNALGTERTIEEMNNTLDNFLFDYPNTAHTTTGLSPSDII